MRAVGPEELKKRLAEYVRLAVAVREGLVTPAALPPGPAPDVRGAISFAALLDDLGTDREDR